MEHELGVYARELLVYTEDMNIPVGDVLSWATFDGAKLARHDHENGMIEEGKIADLLVIGGDPVVPPELLTDPVRNLHEVMLGGRSMKNKIEDRAADADACRQGFRMRLPEPNAVG